MIQNKCDLLKNTVDEDRDIVINNITYKVSFETIISRKISLALSNVSKIR